MYVKKCQLLVIDFLKRFQEKNRKAASRPEQKDTKFQKNELTLVVRGQVTEKGLKNHFEEASAIHMQNEKRYTGSVMKYVPYV